MDELAVEHGNSAGENFMVRSKLPFWTQEELVKLNEAVAVHGIKNWK